MSSRSLRAVAICRSRVYLASRCSSNTPSDGNGESDREPAEHFRSVPGASSDRAGSRAVAPAATAREVPGVAPEDLPTPLSGAGGHGGSGGGAAMNGASGSGGADGGGSGAGGAGSGGDGGQRRHGRNHRRLADAGTPAASAGCGKTPTLMNGTHTIQSSGKDRSFMIRLPDNYDKNNPYWLIFGVPLERRHRQRRRYRRIQWCTHWPTTGCRSSRTTARSSSRPRGSTTAGRIPAADLTFADDMVKLIEDNYCVDTTHLITTGFSYGGGMSYELACARAKVFQAAVLYEGGQLSGCDGGNDPIAIWQWYGLADTTLGIAGARRCATGS